jgi:DNA mismatch endonuclease (patch repair protein)
MADVHTKETRSYNMSRVRSKNTRPELVVRKALFANGFRYRIHDKRLLGKPDIVLKKYRTLIFIHGCFWHGHVNCKYSIIPKTRTKWWADKISSNKVNDTKAISQLKKEGWNVIVIWGCQLKPKTYNKTIAFLMSQFQSSK